MIIEEEWQEMIKNLQLKKENENTKHVQYLLRLPHEKRYNASKHMVWLNGLTDAAKCHLEGCTCRHWKRIAEEDFCEIEIVIFTGVFDKLKRELKEHYPNLDTESFGVEFVIGQIALNQLRLYRANAHETWKGMILGKGTEQRENPVLEYNRKIVNQTMKLLRNLGLTPAQQIEKESWQISKTIEKTIARLQVNPSEIQMEKSVAKMEKISK